MNYYTEDLRVHVRNMSKYQLQLYEIEMWCIVALILTVIIPVSCIMVRSRREDLQLLDVIEEDSFSKHLRNKAHSTIYASDLRSHDR